MSDRLASFARQYVSTHEAARWLGISARTLEKNRSDGCSPTFRKPGSRVVCAMDDLARPASSDAASVLRSADVSSLHGTGRQSGHQMPRRRSFAGDPLYPLYLVIDLKPCNAAGCQLGDRDIIRAVVPAALDKSAGDRYYGE